MSDSPLQPAYIELAADIVSAYVSNNSVAASELPGLISEVHAALVRVASGAPAAAAPDNLRPAVPVKKSVGTDYIICLEDGKKFKSLKRHLRTQYNMSRKIIAKNGVCRRTIQWSPPIMRKPVRNSRKKWA